MCRYGWSSDPVSHAHHDVVSPGLNHFGLPSPYAGPASTEKTPGTVSLLEMFFSLCPRKT